MKDRRPFRQPHDGRNLFRGGFFLQQQHLTAVDPATAFYLVGDAADGQERSLRFLGRDKGAHTLDPVEAPFMGQFT